MHVDTVARVSNVSPNAVRYYVRRSGVARDSRQTIAKESDSCKAKEVISAQLVSHSGGRATAFHPTSHSRRSTAILFFKEHHHVRYSDGNVRLDRQAP